MSSNNTSSKLIHNPLLVGATCAAVLIPVLAVSTGVGGALAGMVAAAGAGQLLATIALESGKTLLSGISGVVGNELHASLKVKGLATLSDAQAEAVKRIIIAFAQNHPERKALLELAKKVPERWKWLLFPPVKENDLSSVLTQEPLRADASLDEITVQLFAYIEWLPIAQGLCRIYTGTGMNGGSMSIQNAVEVNVVEALARRLANDFPSRIQEVLRESAADLSGAYAQLTLLLLLEILAKLNSTTTENNYGNFVDAVRQVFREEYSSLTPEDAAFVAPIIDVVLAVDPVLLSDEFEALRHEFKENREYLSETVKMLERELSNKEGVIITLSGQLSFLQSQIDTKDNQLSAALRVPALAEAYARQIPNTAGDYEISLKAVAEQRFDDARELTDAMLKSELQRTQNEQLRIVMVRCETEFYASNFAELGRWAERALSLEPRDYDTLHVIASYFYYAGNYVTALRLQREVLEAQERKLGSENSDTLASKNNLAATLRAQGEYAMAAQMYEDVMEGFKRSLGPEHSYALTAKNNLAVALRTQGEYAAAAEFFREVLTVRERLYGPEDRNTLISKNNLAAVLHHQGNYDAAIRLYTEVLEVRERLDGSEH